MVQKCLNRFCKKGINTVYDGNAFTCARMDKLPADYEKNHRFCKNCADPEVTIVCNAKGGCTGVRELKPPRSGQKPPKPEYYQPYIIQRKE